MAVATLGEFDTWRVRAVQGQFVGPWSGFGRFRPPSRVTDVIIAPPIVVLREGERLALAAGVLLEPDSPSTPVDATSVVQWSSANPAVVTVNNGLITATAVGAAIVTASIFDKRGTVLVTVLEESSRSLGLRGTIRVRSTGQAARNRLLGNLRVFLDGRLVGSNAASESGSDDLRVEIGTAQSLVANAVLRPGSHELLLQVSSSVFGETVGTVLVEAQRVNVIDLQSGEVVRFIDIAAQQIPVSGPFSISVQWPVEFPNSVFRQSP